MSCIRRERIGSCNHRQCEYSEMSGYECVENFEGQCDGESIYCPNECFYKTKEKKDEHI